MADEEEEESFLLGLLTGILVLEVQTEQSKSGFLSGLFQILFEYSNFQPCKEQV